MDIVLDFDFEHHHSYIQIHNNDNSITVNSNGLTAIQHQPPVTTTVTWTVTG